MAEGTMTGWFRETIVATGRLPLFSFFSAMILGFAFIRFSTRMIRAEVRWWPGNVTPGGLHIHHAVFGVVLMLIGGVIGFALPGDLSGWRSVAAALFGVGSALVLDEFALILRLRDVYWSEEGRESIVAVFVAIAVTGLLVIGVRPDNLDDFLEAASTGDKAEWVFGVTLTALDLTLAAITLLKGKLWTGILGIYFPVLLMFGAFRLARPNTPWSRWRYHRPGDRHARKLARAIRREDRMRRPITQAGIWFRNLVGGRPDP